MTVVPNASTGKYRMSLWDEVTATSPQLIGGTFSSLGEGGRMVAKDIGGRLLNEVGARTGIAIPNLGPDAAATLSAPRGSGTVSPDAPSARNIAQSGGGLMDMLKGKWKWIAGGLAVAGVLWWVLKRKKG